MQAIILLQDKDGVRFSEPEWLENKHRLCPNPVKDIHTIPCRVRLINGDESSIMVSDNFLNIVHQFLLTPLISFKNYNYYTYNTNSYVGTVDFILIKNKVYIRDTTGDMAVFAKNGVIEEFKKMAGQSLKFLTGVIDEKDATMKNILAEYKKRLGEVSG